MSETLYTFLYIDDEEKQTTYSFTDDECIDGVQGRTAKQKRDEFDLEIDKLAKSKDKGHHYSIIKENISDANANYIDIEK